MINTSDVTRSACRSRQQWRSDNDTAAVTCCRDELKTQLSQLTSDLSNLKASFQSMQDFIQLPLVFIWQHQLTSVMQQALAHELSSLPQYVTPESTQPRLPKQASQSTEHNSQPFVPPAAGRMTVQAPTVLDPANDKHPSHAAAATAVAGMVGSELSDSSGHGMHDQPASHGLQTFPEQDSSAQTYGQTESESLPDPAARQAVPGRASAQSFGQTTPVGLPHRASSGRLPRRQCTAACQIRQCLARLLSSGPACLSC